MELAQDAKSPFKLSTQEHKEEKAYYTYLEEKLRRKDRGLWIVDGGKNEIPPSTIHYPSSNYPELFKYFDYLKTAKKIQAEKILKEVTALEESVFSRLARTQDEQDLLRASKNLRYLRKLFLLTMTPEEFAGYKVESRDFDITHLTGFLNKKIMELKDFYENAAFLEKGFDTIVKRAEEFYAITHERDEAFIRNMLKKLDEDSGSWMVDGGKGDKNAKSQFRRSESISAVTSVRTNDLQDDQDISERGAVWSDKSDSEKIGRASCRERV